MSPQNTAVSAAYDQTSGFAGPRSPAGWVFAALSSLGRSISTYYRVNRDISQLRQLSDATLRDIGFSRAEIVSRVMREHYGRAGRGHADH
jgi:uncharacterized protein YjiS (DUF1127 family)